MKTLLKLGIIFIVIGIIGTISFSLVVYGSLDDEERYENIVYTYHQDEIDQIVIDAQNRRINIESHDEEQIEIVFYKQDREDLSFSDSNRTINIDLDIKWYRSLFDWNGLFSFFGPRYLDEISIKLPNQLYDLDIRTANGGITANNFDARSLKLRSSNGKITFENINADSAELRTSNGAIVVKNGHVTDGIDIHTSNGKLTLENLEANRINGITQNGTIEAKKIRSVDVTLRTSNGRVNLEVYGVFEDFRTEVRTSNGSIKINDLKMSNETYNQNNSNRVTAITSNGSINIHFISCVNSILNM